MKNNMKKMSPTCSKHVQPMSKACLGLVRIALAHVVFERRQTHACHICETLFDARVPARFQRIHTTQ